MKSSESTKMRILIKKIFFNENPSFNCKVQHDCDSSLN